MNAKSIVIVIGALAIGLGAGYLLFARDAHPSAVMTEEHSSQDMAASTSEEVWTCSMHPQIRQNEPGDCPICGMELIPVGSPVSDDPLVLTMTQDAVELSNIQTSTVGSLGKLPGKEIKLSGKVKADERNASSLVAHVPGRIEGLNISFTGEYVRKGQKLATIYSPELITAQRELLESHKLKDINKNLVSATRNKLRYWKISEEQIQKIEQSGDIQESFGIYADASGIVTDRRVAVGDYVKVGQALFSLMNLRRVWVVFDAYESDLASIQVGNQIEFTTPALPDKTFNANVTFIDPVVNPNTRTVSIRTEIGNIKANLKPEMLVNGTYKKRATGKSQMTIPKSAVLWTGRRSVVYVKVPDVNIPSFQYREIEIGESIGANYEVLNGLEFGEEVVTYGSFSIDAAAQLNNQISMMNKRVKLKKKDDGTLPNYQAETPQEFQLQMDAVAKEYIHLKDAFVHTDAILAAQAAEKLLAAIVQVDMSLVTGDAHMYWMDQQNVLQLHGEKITTLEDVEEQRKQFGFISEALINSIEAFGITGDALYVIHCPMAFDNQGADWLASESTVRNPYFGDKMMKCGVVKRQTGTAEEMTLPKVSNPNQIHNH